MDSCKYLDAFEKEASLEQFTSSKGHADALKMISEGRIVFLGGYLETGPFTSLLRRNEQEYPEGELDRVINKVGVDKIKKVYLTTGLNKIKAIGFLSSDDGTVNGRQIERECYNSNVRSYAVEFNETMIRELLKGN